MNTKSDSYSQLHGATDQLIDCTKIIVTRLLELEAQIKLANAELARLRSVLSSHGISF